MHVAGYINVRPMCVTGYINVRPLCAARYNKVCNACFLDSVSLLGFLLCKMGGWWPVKRLLLHLIASASGRFHPLHPKVMSSEPILAAALGCANNHNLEVSEIRATMTQTELSTDLHA